MAKRFEKALVVDWESTGIYNLEAHDIYVAGPQGIQIGACIVEDIRDTWTVVEEFSSKMSFLGPDPDTKAPGEYPDLTWSEEAFQVHRLSRAHLRDHPHPSEVGRRFARFLSPHFSRQRPVFFAGYNPAFDLYHTKQMLFFADLFAHCDYRFNHRVLDAFTAGFFVTGAENSNELFKLLFNRTRTTHDALEDARMTVDAFRELTRRLGGIKVPQG